MKIIGKIFYGLFVLLLVSVTGLFLLSFLPIAGNIEVKIVKSGSMEPTIKTGSVAIVKPEADYFIGNIVTFGEDSRRQIPTTHRIYGVREEGGKTYFTTKGDANEEPDPAETEESEVIGKVIFSVPYAGYILDFARQPLGFTLLIGVPATIVILDEVWAIAKEISAWRRKRRGEVLE